MSNPDVGAGVTSIVRDWIQVKGVDDESLEDAMAIVRGREHSPESAKQLESWFLERLTVDPGMPGPFCDLGASLLGTVLDLVDWKAIIRFMRERED